MKLKGDFLGGMTHGILSSTWILSYPGKAIGVGSQSSCLGPEACDTENSARFVAHLKMCQDWNCGTRNRGLECSKLKGMYRRGNGRDNVKRQHQNVSAVTFPQDCWIRVLH
ncbi:hypothetical protein KIL84_015010 [Mauremys mutica]|uniref:Uncharacterized protein n=1 Tax=Mauremys mutica TaxID=74926 RepID=A0A9D4B8V8_9SAUR|nr:hypothetical protein KIL84_015010 [Mauremys mutica]